MSADKTKQDTAKAAQQWRHWPGCYCCAKAEEGVNARAINWPPFVRCTVGDFPTPLSATCDEYVHGFPKTPGNEGR